MATDSASKARSGRPARRHRARKAGPRGSCMMARTRETRTVERLARLCSTSASSPLTAARSMSAVVRRPRDTRWATKSAVSAAEHVLASATVARSCSTRSLSRSASEARAPVRPILRSSMARSTMSWRTATGASARLNTASWNSGSLRNRPSRVTKADFTRTASGLARSVRQAALWPTAAIDAERAALGRDLSAIAHCTTAGESATRSTSSESISTEVDGRDLGRDLGRVVAERQHDVVRSGLVLRQFARQSQPDDGRGIVQDGRHRGFVLRPGRVRQSERAPGRRQPGRRPAREHAPGRGPWPCGIAEAARATRLRYSYHVAAVELICVNKCCS